jgi:hypothetical protein
VLISREDYATTATEMPGIPRFRGDGEMAIVTIHPPGGARSVAGVLLRRHPLFVFAAATVILLG